MTDRTRESAEERRALWDGLVEITGVDFPVSIGAELMGAVITGTGVSIPDNVVTNHDLSRIMDTTDEWITSRTGVKERRFADPGIGASDLAVAAVAVALDDAGLHPRDVDALVTATMTPDYLAPGIAGLVQAGVGMGHVAAYDIRQQCSGFLYGLDLADALIGSGRAETVVVVGAEDPCGLSAVE